MGRERANGRKKDGEADKGMVETVETEAADTIERKSNGLKEREEKTVSSFPFPFHRLLANIRRQFQEPTIEQCD